MAVTSKVGIVISVRNCLDLTIAAIDSISTRHPYQLYVIDDRSDAPMKEWLAGRPDITSFIDPQSSSGIAWNWNLGIAASLNDDCTHVLVINNDIVLHAATIDRLVERIDRGDVDLVGGFDIRELDGRLEDLSTWQVDRGTDRELVDFSCFMMTVDMVRRFGWFDENFQVAYYEDNDYYARLIMEGGRAERCGAAPYFHHSMRTVQENPEISTQVRQCAARNAEYFHQKWGRMPAASSADIRETYRRDSLFAAEAAEHRLEEMFRRASETPSDISEHVGVLRQLACSIRSITEFGGSAAQSTIAFASAKPESLRVYEPKSTPENTRVEAAARLAGIDFQRIAKDAVDCDIEPTDLLFIDSLHVDEQMRKELNLHASKALKYLIMHDTETYCHRGELPRQKGIWPAISDYMRSHPEWRLLHHFSNNNGLTVFVRS